MVIVIVVWVRSIVVSCVDGVLDRAVPNAMMIARGLIQVVGVPIAAIRCECVVEIEHRDIVVRIIFEPIIHEPKIKRTRVRGGLRTGAAGT